MVPGGECGAKGRFPSEAEGCCCIFEVRAITGRLEVWGHRFPRCPELLADSSGRSEAHRSVTSAAGSSLPRSHGPASLRLQDVDARSSPPYSALFCLCLSLFKVFFLVF